MPIQLSFDEDGRKGLLKGIEALSRAVGSTLGPRGRNAVLDKSWGSPTITKDGVTVSEEIELVDPYENLGAQLVREVASKTSDAVGDGTTTATVLAHALFREGLKCISAGSDAMSLVRGVHKAVNTVVAELRKLAKAIPANDSPAIATVAAIAAHNDPEIGAILADALQKAGQDGVIVVEAGRQLGTEIDQVEGMRFDRGYLSPHFVTNSDDQRVELENCLILLYQQRISNVKELVPILEKVSQTGKPLLIIAKDIEGEALATLVINKLRGVLKVGAVKAPLYGDRRRAMLDDIATQTGGKVFDNELEIVELADLGSAGRVYVDSESTTIIEGRGDKADIARRCEAIRQEIEVTTGEYDVEKLQERLAKLAGGVVRINVGAATETEMKERMSRVKDALVATRAAIEEGIVPGGGVSLMRCSSALDALATSGDEQIGVRLLQGVLRTPTQTIAANAGLDGAVVVNRILQDASVSHGYDALNDRYGDMFEFGVVDPTKVVRSALQNAASAAGLLLTTDSLVVPDSRRREESAVVRFDDMASEEGDTDVFGFGILQSAPYELHYGIDIDSDQSDTQNELIDDPDRSTEVEAASAVDEFYLNVRLEGHDRRPEHIDASETVALLVSLAMERGGGSLVDEDAFGPDVVNQLFEHDELDVMVVCPDATVTPLRGVLPLPPEPDEAARFELTPHVGVASIRVTVLLLILGEPLHKAEFDLDVVAGESHVPQ